MPPSKLNPKTAHWYDKNIGRPLCFFLTLQRKLFDALRKEKLISAKPAKILFIKLIEQGSTVLAAPAIKKAQELVGKNNVYFMVITENRPVLDLLNLVPAANIIEIGYKNIVQFVFSLTKNLAGIRKKNIDVVLDLEFFSRASAIIAYLCGADKRVGLHRFTDEGPYRGDLFTHKLMYNPHLHTKTFFLSLVHALNHTPPRGDTPMVFSVPAINSNPAVFLPTPEEKKSLVSKVEKLKNGSLTAPVIILNPKIKDILPLRRWPQEKFVRLAKMILQKFPEATIIITGPPKEKKEAQILASQIAGAVSVAGHISLKELLTLYCAADILVTSDSGPAHFSSLTPIKSVVLFGPETPLLYGDAGEKNKAVTSNLVCSPCLNVYNARKSPCAGGVCLKNIKAEDVYKEVLTFLERK